MNSIGTLRGTIYIYEHRKQSRLLVNMYKNMFMQVVKSSFLDFLEGRTPIIGTYAFLAIGTDSTPVTANDTQLGNETFRKPLTNIERIGNKLLCECYLEASEANITMKELGLFDSSAEWDSPNSGILLNRAIVNETKNEGIAKTISWSLELL
jgi:hypothetical protein